MSEQQQAAAGPSSMTNTDTVVNTSQPKSDFKVYKPSDVIATVPSALPDEYFIPTSSDLKAAQSQLAARTQALTNAPLQLKSVKEAEDQAKRDRWPITTIRIRFTDRTQLEKAFPSTDKIRSVYAFVRGLLREDVKPIKFILYQPPKRDLKVSDLKVRDLTLAQLQLAPSSVLLIRFEDDSLNGSHVPAPLITNVLSQAVDLPRPPEVLDTPPPNVPMSRIPGSSGSSSETKKVPKWLKLAKK
ncbi:uncharacterized protein BT62DRAFT_926636 [Guyanagaster necrorhizus]|uniref:UBX domain-containing protein n=1 Tax=Guyanagaster necrorhizus TaxID=856835 RepID=A0A9P7W1F7_9AGAR|nr:uncharacterized protein BT62DRAFT_926636 [Guyanagaster necrorhizus MCA 3950]KAG7450973.1 hypothetical protein BT62DRAFT_926636 [Guyanagaster necrorhizus MCA 3950]